MMADEISKQLELLLSGYGVNFYRTENQMRADDLLVRQRAGTSFGYAAERLEQLARLAQPDRKAWFGRAPGTTRRNMR